MDAFDMQHLLASGVVAAVGLALLGVLFGFGRRTVAATIALVIGVGVVYPGGSVGLIVDALRPFRGLTDSTQIRRDARRAVIDEASGEHRSDAGR